MADLETLRRRLVEAEDAHHSLQIGRHEASVSYEGKQVSYSKSEIGKLGQYIEELRSKIAALEGRPRRKGYGGYRVGF